ncbi:MAG TPA: tetratricopeptide repeat protein [Candidatus Obscuribacterales bacterium]
MRLRDQLIACLLVSGAFAACASCPAQVSGGQYYIQGRPVSAETAQAALLVNEGLALIRANRNEDAVAKLNTAVQLAPALPEAHHNLGIALAKLGRYPEAIEHLQIVLEARPDLASTWLTLGGLYQSTGQLDQSIYCYRQFLNRFPTHGEVPKITNLVKGLEGEAKRAHVSTASSGGPSAAAARADYYAEVTQQGVFRWPARRMPIKVKIHPGDGVPGYQSGYEQILKDAFQEWADASNGLVSFVFVVGGGQADINCSWTNDQRKLSNAAEAGEARVFTDSEGIARGTITLLTVPLSPELPITENRMRTVCLHEIGHVLGLGGHTTNPDDIMFYTSSLDDVAKHLSDRDRATLVRLYSGR